MLHLSQNFRSRPALLRFVNRVFAALLTASAEAGQVAYQPIAPPPGLPEEPSVIALRFAGPERELGPGPAGGRGARARRLPGRGRCRRLSVRDPLSGAERASRAGDVMVLARRLTQVRRWSRLSRRAGLRFTLEGGKSFFDRQEVHEVLAALRAVDDPSDRVSLVAALRGVLPRGERPRHRAYALAGGPLCCGRERREPAGGRRRRCRPWGCSRSSTGCGCTLASPRCWSGSTTTRASWRPSPSRRGGPDRQSREGRGAGAPVGRAGRADAARLRPPARGPHREAREEPDLPATRPGDPDTLRVLSIHKAKGLEAPIVALYDTDDRGIADHDRDPLWEEGRIAIGFREGCQPPDWHALRRREEKRAGPRPAGCSTSPARARATSWSCPGPPADAALGAFWKELVDRLPAASGRGRARGRRRDGGRSPSGRPRPELRALAGAEGGDAVGARWDAQREELLRAARPSAATRRSRPRAPRRARRPRPWRPWRGPRARLRPAGAPPPGMGAFEDARRAERAARWPRPSRRLTVSTRFAAARAAADVGRVLAMPLLERARQAPRAWRELRCGFPTRASWSRARSTWCSRTRVSWWWSTTRPTRSPRPTS